MPRKKSTDRRVAEYYENWLKTLPERWNRAFKLAMEVVDEYNPQNGQKHDRRS